jgi:GTPase SAR1 family protein
MDGIEFASYKKLIVFGSEGTGKTSLSKRIERGSFTNETHPGNGK